MNKSLMVALESNNLEKTKLNALGNTLESK